MNKSENSENFAENQCVVETVKQIRRLILASMDGVTAAKLRETTAENRQNLGVALPRLREIAASFEPNYEVAQSLWHIGTRECKIVASGLVPNDVAVCELLVEWLPQIDTLELAEVTAFYLAQKCVSLDALIGFLLQSDNTFARTFLYHLCARRVECLTQAQIARIVENATQRELAQYEAMALLNFLLRVHDTKSLNTSDLATIFGILKSASDTVCQRVVAELEAITEL